MKKIAPTTTKGEIIEVYDSNYPKRLSTEMRKEEIMDHIGTRIHEQRVNFGISLADFGKLAGGKTAITVLRWEAGTEPITQNYERLELVLRLWRDVDSVRHILDDKSKFRVDEKQWEVFSDQLKGALQIAKDPSQSVNREYNAKTIVGATLNLLFFFDQASLGKPPEQTVKENLVCDQDSQRSELGLKEPDDALIPLLRKCRDEELAPLVGYILKALTNSLDITEVYKRHYPHHHYYSNEIAAEIQQFGGNSLVNIVRGTGVTYNKIVQDVAKRLKVTFDKDIDDVSSIEMRIHMKIIQKAWGKMSDEEKKELLKDLGLTKILAAGIPKTMPLAAVQTAINAGGFSAYTTGLKLTLKVANGVAKLILGRGLQLGTNAAIASATTRIMSFLAGPIGWAISGILTIIQLAGPAYRVTIPCVLHIGMLRRLKEFEAASSKTASI